MWRRPSIFSLSIFLTCAHFCLYGQDTLTLDQSYKELLRTSETYEVYKVIRTERLNSFWDSVLDSVAAHQDTIQELRNALDTQIAATQSEKQKSQAAQAMAEELRDQVDSITFLGAPIGEGAYHTIVWTIIAALLVFLSVVLWRFKESHRVTAVARKELEAISADLENHREKARKKEVKLKRELQTAINELEARKRGDA